MLPDESSFLINTDRISIAHAHLDGRLDRMERISTNG